MDFSRHNNYHLIAVQVHIHIRLLLKRLLLYGHELGHDFLGKPLGISGAKVVYTDQMPFSSPN